MPSRSRDVTFMVSEMKRAISYYEDGIGLPEKSRFSICVGLGCSGVEIGLVPTGTATV
jgi:hypothetical protein